MGRNLFYGGEFFSLSFYKKTYSILLQGVGWFRNTQYLIPKALGAYKRHLEYETIILSHPWKFDQQTLKDTIIPIHFEKSGQLERIAMIDLIKDSFPTNIATRLIILGDAGSGKSVAIGEIARNIWYIKRKETLLPVVLKFTEIKNSKNEEDFITAIIQNLKKCQFEGEKGAGKAEEFVRNNIFKGKILLLLDGLDELEKSVRFEIVQFLNQFFQTHSNISFVISCRTSVWKQNPLILNTLNHQIITMANFTPFDIRLFVSQWAFSEGKSGDQLANLINDKVYLKAITTNPLMLTIITFLYAQPKRILPDNRVKFYEECVDALLEKWDNAKILDRANEFETIDKVSILNYLAYNHIVDNKYTDEEITKENVLNGIETIMRKLSRPVQKREKMLQELVENAELLIPLPPDGYKFPHRTFMEYFAAKYFNEEKQFNKLVELYRQDPGKWEETLCLFCGLNTNSEISESILKIFIEDFKETIYSPSPNTIIFRLLVESARISPHLADEILILADTYLKTNINTSIIENLGFIAINQTWAHADKSKKILLKQLSKKLTNLQFQQVIMALANLKDKQIQGIIIKQANRINLVAFIGSLGKNAEILADKLLESLSINKSIGILKGIKDAGRLEFLVSLMLKSKNNTIQEEAAYQLATISNSREFFNLMDNSSISEANLSLRKDIEKKYKDWKWNYSLPEKSEGKKVLFALAIILSRKNTVNLDNIANPAIKYIVMAFKLQLNSRSSLSIIDLNIFSGSYFGLLKTWKLSLLSSTRRISYFLYFFISFIIHISLIYYPRITYLPSKLLIYASPVLVILFIILIISQILIKKYITKLNDKILNIIGAYLIIAIGLLLPTIFIFFVFFLGTIPEIFKQIRHDISRVRSWNGLIGLIAATLPFFIFFYVLFQPYEVSYKLLIVLSYLWPIIYSILASCIYLVNSFLFPNFHTIKGLEEKNIIPSKNFSAPRKDN